MSTWDTNYKNKPAGTDAPSTLDNEQRTNRTSIEVRMENEHDTFEDGTSGLASADWRHKEGSARVYYQSAEPTNQPGANGAALDSGDDGRIWIDSDIDELFFYSGSAFVSIGKINTNLIFKSKRITSDNYLHDAAATYNEIFDKLSPFIPDTNNEMLLSGGFTSNVVSRVKRKDATTVTIYYLTSGGSIANTDFGDGVATTTSISIAW